MLACFFFVFSTFGDPIAKTRQDKNDRTQFVITSNSNMKVYPFFHNYIRSLFRFWTRDCQKRSKALCDINDKTPRDNESILVKSSVFKWILDSTRVSIRMAKLLVSLIMVQLEWKKQHTLICSKMLAFCNKDPKSWERSRNNDYVTLSWSLSASPVAISIYLSFACCPNQQCDHRQRLYLVAVADRCNPL